MTESRLRAEKKKQGRERYRRAKQSAFLLVFGRIGSVTGAAREAGVSRSTHYNWLETDLDYAEQFENTNEELADALEEEARRRALEGVDEPVYYRGERVGSFRKYSDALLILLLRAKRPEQFRDSVAINNTIDAATGVIDPAIMNTLTDEELEMARTLGRKLAGLETSPKPTR